MSELKGVTYFKRNKIYEGDTRKNCSLTGSEIDNNFYFLRGREITEGLWDDENKCLIFKTLDGNEINITGFTIDYTVSFSGSSYDSETGVLNIKINDNELSLSGFSTCDKEEIDGRFLEIESQLSEDLPILYESISALTETVDENNEFFAKEIERIKKKLIIFHGTIEEIKIDICRIEQEIDRIKKDISDISGATENLANELNKEISARMSEDEKLRNEIEVEKTRAEDVESRLETAINSEIKRAEAKEQEIEEVTATALNTLKNSLEEESERAKQSESGLKDDIDSVKNEVEIAIQINSKVRAKQMIATNLTDKEIEGLVLQNETVKGLLEGKQVKKVIVIKGRLVNVIA